MPISYRVKCTTKDRYGRINYLGGTTDVGGYGWYKGEIEVINAITYGTGEFYTLVDGKKAMVIVAYDHDRRPYLKTAADTTTKNNLDSLDACAL